ncbi:MAG: hypothetical protein P4L96_13655 [Rhodoferax sp.]|nr:hypothetical protein [Rhodoferax sp.]
MNTATKPRTEAAVLAFARPLAPQEKLAAKQEELMLDIGRRRTEKNDEIGQLRRERDQMLKQSYDASQRQDFNRVSELSAQASRLDNEMRRVKAALPALDQERERIASGQHPQLAILQGAVSTGTATAQHQAHEAAVRRLRELLTLEIRAAASDVLDACKPLLLRAPDVAVAIVSAPR